MQQTAYEMRISDWSSDVCSSDLRVVEHPAQRVACGPLAHPGEQPVVAHVGQALLEVGHAAQVHGGVEHAFDRTVDVFLVARRVGGLLAQEPIGRASCRERVCPSVSVSVVTLSLK